MTLNVNHASSLRIVAMCLYKWVEHGRSGVLNRTVVDCLRSLLVSLM